MVIRILVPDALERSAHRDLVGAGPHAVHDPASRLCNLRAGDAPGWIVGRLAMPRVLRDHSRLPGIWSACDHRYRDCAVLDSYHLADAELMAIADPRHRYQIWPRLCWRSALEVLRRTALLRLSGGGLEPALTGGARAAFRTLGITQVAP